MSTTNNESHSIIRVEIGCPSCGTRLHNGKMLEGQDEAQLSHYQCEECLHYCLALVFQTQVGISSVVMITDLNFEDVVRLRGGDPITPDDVLDLHEMLQHKQSALLLAMRRKKQM